MDTDLRDEIERSLGDEPPLAATDLVDRGHAALRRRRLGASAGAVAVVAAVVTTVVITGQQGSPQPTPVAPATSSATPRPPGDHVRAHFEIVPEGSLPRSEPVRVELPDRILVRPDARVRQVVADPYGPDLAFSAAVEYQYRHRTYWFLGFVRPDGGGNSEIEPAEHRSGFRAWARGLAADGAMR